jgi:hypothetical protein
MTVMSLTFAWQGRIVDVRAWLEMHLWGTQFGVLTAVLLVRCFSTANRTLILKRLAVWLIEALCEALLLSVLLILYIRVSGGPDQHVSYSRQLLFLFAAILTVFMFASGYLLTTAIFGVVSRSQRSWLYPTIAAVLYLAHLHIAFGGARSGLSLAHWDLPQRLTLEAAGACVVFACTWVGTSLLRRWVTRTGVAVGGMAR